MKNVMFLALFSLIMGNSLFSQQSHLKGNDAGVVYPMAIFPPNSPQAILETGAISKKIQFQLYSSENYKNEFSKNILADKSVISCNYDKNFKAGTLVNLDLSPEADFDFFKALLKKNGIQYVSIEDTLLAIDNWHPFTKEQLARISQLNLNIYNIEFKRNWVMERENERKMAIENGWMEDNDNLLKNARKEKKEYIRQQLNN
jgi:hypothetical protein